MSEDKRADMEQYIQAEVKRVTALARRKWLPRAGMLPTAIKESIVDAWIQEIQVRLETCRVDKTRRGLGHIKDHAFIGFLKEEYTDSKNGARYFVYGEICHLCGDWENHHQEKDTEHTGTVEASG